MLREIRWDRHSATAGFGNLHRSAKQQSSTKETDSTEINFDEFCLLSITTQSQVRLYEYSSAICMLNSVHQN